ncbi:hypothetical protein HMPREF3200_00117 [Anaerococcus tetradius]|uniref:Uncharacterized protein n=1 Tax=Anaerococcus tetradius TaxID=33036 RepID=A0A133KIF6_9FIRM|nr:hypothetical protein HMPREF3200_00117 [Anaerococcus tetradius]
MGIFALFPNKASFKIKKGCVKFCVLKLMIKLRKTTHLHG